MATAWPSLPGLSLVIEVEWVPTNSEFKADDGSAVITNRGTTRKRYTFHYNYLRHGKAAPSPYAAYDEPAALDYIIGQASVTSGQFTFADPWTGSTVTTRIEQPPRMRQEEPGTYATADIVFVTDP